MKMKAVTIAGQLDCFDTIVEKYIYGRDIHLEKADSVLTNTKRLENFKDNNDYETLAKSAESILKLAGYDISSKLIESEEITLEEMQEYIAKINLQIESEKRKSDELEKRIEINKSEISRMDLMLGIDVDLKKLFNLEFIKFKFGHIPKTGYKTLVTYLNRLETIFVKTAEDATDVWGFYFVPLLKEHKVEEVFNSLYFEAVEVSREYEGTPAQIKERLILEDEDIQKQIEELRNKTSQILTDSSDKLCGIMNLAIKRKQFAEVRKNAVHSDLFFYVVGWMEEKDALLLEKEINSSNDVVMFYREEPDKIKNSSPPTKLKNNPVFRPFEMFVKMYGLPDYKEIDPTPILAVTYILFFGIMFGDVGQAALLAVFGFLLYKKKKMDLAGIVGTVGISGVIFGFLYGSFFGNEEIISKLFHTKAFNPMEQITIMLGGTIAIGALIIIFGMLLNVINNIKSGKKGEAVFGHNGIAGIVFYITVILLAADIFLEWGAPAGIFAGILVLTFLSMYMSEPLSKLVAGKKNWLPDNGMFYVENLFEMFEVVLSFFTNTISFLRIGAFAIVHVGMMMVVSVLSNGGGIGGFIVMVIGNIIVMGLEGLIVGIQVLRLEYYEMFSRYFTGDGKPFISLKDK